MNTGLCDGNASNWSICDHGLTSPRRQPGPPLAWRALVPLVFQILSVVDYHAINVGMNRQARLPDGVATGGPSDGLVDWGREGFAGKPGWPVLKHLAIRVTPFMPIENG